MFSPITTLYTYFPLTFFLRVLLLLLIDVSAAVIVYKLYKKNVIDKSRAVCAFLLVVYVTVVLFFTVLGRRTLEYYRFGMDAVSYYVKLFSGGVGIDITELWLNVVMFVPVGALVCFVVQKHRMLKAVAMGFSLSLFIELCQFVLRNGYVSLPDVIHNTLGALLGGLAGIFIVFVVSKFIRRSK